MQWYRAREIQGMPQVGAAGSAAARARKLRQPFLPRVCCQAAGRVDGHHPQLPHVLNVHLHVVHKLWHGVGWGRGRICRLQAAAHAPLPP